MIYNLKRGECVRRVFAKYSKLTKYVQCVRTVDENYIFKGCDGVGVELCMQNWWVIGCQQFIIVGVRSQSLCSIVILCNLNFASLHLCFIEIMFVAVSIISCLAYDRRMLIRWDIEFLNYLSWWAMCVLLTCCIKLYK